MLTLGEIFDIVVMSLAIGFIFKDSFPRPVARKHDPIKEWKESLSGKSDQEALLFAILIAAPAVILHEMSHKFVALFFGISATFHAAYTWLLLGVFLKMLNFPFIFFIPGYVSYASEGVPLVQSALISIAGPLMNLLLFVGAWAILKYGKVKSRKWQLALYLTKSINLFLFIFNMIPIPPFDGGSFFMDVFRMFVH